MAAKSLIRTGASLMNRMVLSNPILKHNTSSPISSHGLQITPQLFPSLSKFQNTLQFPQNDNILIERFTNEGFMYPCGLPYLPFYLPDGNSSDEPMLLFPKRTFQPSTLRRKRNHGYFARKATKGGRKVIARRIAKGRSRITA